MANITSLIGLILCVLSYGSCLFLHLQEGFRYHHAEPDYLMLVKWIPETADTLPANASHRVGIGAFVMNDNREVLFLHLTLILLCSLGI